VKEASQLPKGGDNIGKKEMFGTERRGISCIKQNQHAERRNQKPPQECFQGEATGDRIKRPSLIKKNGRRGSPSQRSAKVLLVQKKEGGKSEKLRRRRT